MTLLNETHDPALNSWVPSANKPEIDFPIQNLPLAVFRRKGSNESWRGGVAIGDQIVDLAALHSTGTFAGLAGRAIEAGAKDKLNALMALGQEAWSALRLALSQGLRSGSVQQNVMQACLVAQAEAEYDVPSLIGDYTDFYVGIHHATSVGKLFRPDNPLLPNYKWVPIGYHGRASTILASGKPFVRPQGQLMPPNAAQPVLAPTKRLDFELELGVFIGTGNPQGQAIAIGEAESHVFGLALFNDWSARDVQGWEYQPLGPFLSKNFASTVSPWIVTMEALAPFRRPFVRAEGEPQPLPYLDCPGNRTEGAMDVELQVLLQTRKMREAGLPAETISRSNFADAAFWTIAQMVTHHTVNGCALASGDLLGTGTLSGPQANEAGSLLELTQGGQRPISLPNGEQRTFVEDGDSVALAGRCRKAGFRSIGFGPCEATVLPAVQ
nr:fumarylacetoacetase [uncultured Rhodoferax sp.]